MKILLASMLNLILDGNNTYLLVLFSIIGFFAGFFLRLNSQKGKKQFRKMEKDAINNTARINSLKEKIEVLKKENKSLGGTYAED